MPIWSEILVLSLAAYALGLGAGWFIWGRRPQEARLSDDADGADGADNDEYSEESP